MKTRILAATVAVALLPAPLGTAWASCAEDLQAFDDQIIAAEAGTTVQGQGGSDMPATEHQEEVLGETAGEAAPMETAAGDPVGGAEPLTEHQRQALRGLETEDRDYVALIITEARAAAQAGDEDGCRARLQEARELAFGE